MKNLQ